MALGAPGGSRTPDTRFRKPLLYPLSYWGRGWKSIPHWPERDNLAHLPIVRRFPNSAMSKSLLIFLTHLREMNLSNVSTARPKTQSLKNMLRLLARGLLLLAVLVVLNRLPQKLVLVGPQQQVETLNLSMGVHTRLTDEVEEWKIKRTLEMVREMGSPWIVEYFPWGYYEPVKGRYQWEHADMVVDHALAQGLTVIARIDFVPQWARPVDTTYRYLDADHYADYARFVGAFMQHFRGRIKHLIIWNEPNLAFEWGYRLPDPEEYTELLRQSYLAAKTADPSVQVLAAGLAPTMAPEGSPWGMDDLLYLERMYQAGAAQWFDAMAIHAYGFTFPPDDPPDRNEVNFARATLIHDLMVAQGDSNKPCYITEGGWNDHARWTKAVRPYQRIAYTVRAYEIVEQDWDWCQAACLWVFRFPWPQNTYQDSFSMVTPEFIPKPIYVELRHYSHGEPFEYLEPR